MALDSTLTVDLTAFTKLRGAEASTLLSQLSRQELRYRPAVISALREVYRFLSIRNEANIRRDAFENFVGAIIQSVLPQLPRSGVDVLVDRLWVNAATLSVDESVSQLVAHARKMFARAVATRGHIELNQSAEEQKRLLVDLSVAGGEVRGGSVLSSHATAAPRRSKSAKRVTQTVTFNNVPAVGAGQAEQVSGVASASDDDTEATASRPGTLSRRQLYQGLFWLADTFCASSVEAEYTSFLQFWLAVAQVRFLSPKTDACK
jgi:hypothetical protein